MRAHSLACRRAAQDGRLPLHDALQNNASDAVVLALLAAHSEGAKEKDGDGRLPLHHAAGHMASEAVVRALLVAHQGAAKEKDRVRPPRPHNPLRCVAPLACVLALTCSPPRCAGWIAATALCCRREGVSGGG